MEAAARIATSLLLALAVASTFLCDGAHGGRGGRRHATRRTRHDSSWPTTTSAQSKRGALPRARRRRDRVRSPCTTSSRASAPPGTAWRTTPARSRPRGAPRAGAAAAGRAHVPGARHRVQRTEPGQRHAPGRRDDRGAGLVDGKGAEMAGSPLQASRVGTHGANAYGSCDSPVAVRFFLSNDVTVQGLKVQNSPQFHVRFDGCRGMVVRGLAISSPAQSPNTNGIHVENSTDVLIASSATSGGDDCIFIGAGTSGARVEDVTRGPGGHGISIGSLGSPGHGRACPTGRCAARRSSGRTTACGSRRGRAPPGPCRQCCSRTCAWRACATTAVSVSGVSYADVRSTYEGGGAHVRLACSDAAPCTGITLSDVECHDPNL
ncbi:polygalacturonase [Panicum miliaceum]|uniref:Polygalacturonase n=1 Tax=Panicum miliaceum TaxID=4540 RepID=A0A3L6QNX8_PANMI|nr:polygalacturonase [Panicum miliaceum]